MTFLSFVRRYRKTSSAHGFRYLVEGSNIFERLLWILIIATALSIACMMVVSNLRDSKENPISISVDAIPIQDLPFPAVTMNAAKLPHRYRLVQAVFNDVKFDCSGSGFDQDCETCINETKRAREDLHQLTRVLLDMQISEHSHECRYHLTQFKSKEEARQHIREKLVQEVCWKGSGSDYVRVTSSCLANRKTYFAQKSKLLEIMARSFRISDCDQVQNRTFDELADICDDVTGIGNNLDYGDDCESIVMSLTNDVLCYALATWTIPIQSSSQRTFNPGDVLKTVFERRKEPTSHALKLLEVMMNQQPGEYFPHECLWATVSTYGIRRNMYEECEKQGYGLKFWLGNLNLVYKFQKQFIAPVSKVPNLKSETADANVIRHFLQDQYQYKMKNQPIVYDYASVLSSKFGDKQMSQNCDIFSNMFTTSGIGYKFNNVPFWTLFKNTTGNSAFYQELYERVESFDSELPRSISQTGQSFSLDFVLRLNSYGYKYNGDKAFGTYREVYLALHDPAKLPNLMSEGILIQPGLFYDIRVIPSLTITDESGLALEPKARKCLTKNENGGLGIFNSYSQSACHLECNLNMAKKNL